MTGTEPAKCWDCSQKSGRGICLHILLRLSFSKGTTQQNPQLFKFFLEQGTYDDLTQWFLKKRKSSGNRMQVLAVSLAPDPKLLEF